MVMNQGAYLVPENPAYGAYRWNIILVTNTVRQQSVPDLPGKDSRILLFQFLDVCHYLGRRDARLAASYGSWQDGASFVIPSEDLGHTPVRHTKLSRYVTRSDSELSQFHDAQTNGVRKRPPVHEHTSQLVHLPILLTLRICKTKKKLF
jgi:hypothetical protein